MESLVKSCNACLVWSSIRKNAQCLQINKLQICPGKVELFCLFCLFNWVWCGMPVVLWNNKSLIPPERVGWFCWFFACSYWISIEATNICYVGLALSDIGSQTTSLSDVLSLKKLKTIWGIRLIFCFHSIFCSSVFWVSHAKVSSKSL